MPIVAAARAWRPATTSAARSGCLQNLSRGRLYVVIFRLVGAGQRRRLLRRLRQQTHRVRGRETTEEPCDRCDEVQRVDVAREALEQRGDGPGETRYELHREAEELAAVPGTHCVRSRARAEQCTVQCTGLNKKKGLVRAFLGLAATRRSRNRSGTESFGRNSFARTQ